jgi:lipid II isoglutaminyl synthase (glutamine-hydrolysing)
VAAFLGQATAQGRIAAVLGCGTRGAHAYRAAGLACIYLGDEAVLDLEGFTLEGRALRIARQSWHRARRAGLTATVCRVGDLDPGQRAALHALSARWRGAAPERGFSMALGRLLDPRDPGGFLVVGRAAGGRLLGFLHLVPWGDDGASLDVMRRERDAPAILNDFLVVEAARRLPALGVRRLSLNFAFQRAVLEAGAGRHIPLRARTARWALCRLTRQFPVETLYRFNKKFAPAWQPRYLAIQAPEGLPTVAVACLKAEGLLAPESWGFSRRFTGVSSGLAYKGPGRIQAAQESDRTMPEPSVRPGGGRRPADPIVAAGTRLAGAAIRASGRGQGATLPGLLAERIAPGIAARRAARLDRVVLVSGTNGKTTTTAMLAAALAAGGRRVASNAAGSNLYRGLVTALLAACPATQDAVLEVDEAVLAKAVQELRPRLVVLLNLTRDQLDRHYEVGGLARRWRQAVAALAPDAMVVANGAEPPTAWVAQAAPSALLVRVEGGGLGRDHAGCPACGGLLSRTGSESCGHCGWAAGPASVRVRRDGHQARLDGPGGSWPVRLPVASDGSAVDVAAAWAAATRLGVDPAAALATIAGIGTVQGRYATCSWRGVRLRLLLAKNPAGWDEALSAADDRRRPAVVAVNAGIPDGRDTSWLWDVDMARLHDRPLVAATGRRAEDVALRLEVAGVPCRIERPLEAAIARAGVRPGHEVDLFADYTSFRQARELIGRRG